MENRKTKKLLQYLKDNDIIRIYQCSFDKYLNLDSLYLISDDNIDLIVCENKYESAVRLYEIINNVKINDDIKNYIYSLTDEEIIKYCLRLSISNDFEDDEKKLNYIKALSESNKDVVKYSYGIASSKLYIDSEDGVEYVKMIGKCDENAALELSYLLHSDKYRSDEELFEFINLVKDIKKDYIALYMIDLFKNEDANTKRIPISYISILMCAKDITQAGLVYKLLNNEKLIKRDDITAIALLIATCEDENKAYKAYESLINNDIENDDFLTDRIFDIVNEDILKCKVKKCKY